MGSYTMPPFHSSNSQLIGYLREATQQGESWLASQKPSAEFATIMDRLTPVQGANDLLGQSNARYPKTEHLAREIVAGLTSFSTVGEFKPLAKKDLFDKAVVLTKLDHHWWKLAQTMSAFRAIIQSAVALGTGYAWQTWDPHFYGQYKGDIRLRALSPDQITFVQLPGDHDIQRAYIVLIREEMPINLAKRVYARTNPQFADSLLPDRDQPGWVAKGTRKVQEFLSPALRVRGMRPGEHDQDTSFPTVDIYHAYILDDSINETGAPMKMGALGTNWQYDVPTLGGEVVTSFINQGTGRPFTRPADRADAMLFPLRRYTIFARSTDIVCYDGTSPWWHGMAPVARFAFNDWPWEALGRSAVSMAIPMEDSINAILQGIEDSIAARLDPPALYDDKAVSKTFAEAFNPRKAGSRAAADLSQGNPINFPIPADNYNVPQWISNHVEWLSDQMEYLTSARDLTAIAKAKQLPAGDTMEKLLEMAGPITQDMVRGMILPMMQLGQMRKSDYFQFYGYNRVIQETDFATQQESDWEYRPELLVDRLSDPLNNLWRAQARQLIEEFTYRVNQSGITELNRMTTKLFYLQLMKLGNFPLDWWSFAKVAQIPMFGEEPEGSNSVMERWIAQMHIMRELQEELQGGQGGGGGGAPGAPGGGPPGGAPGLIGATPRRGRPPTNAKPPHIVQKDGGTRSTISTS
jgi:hypothetical protein